MVDGATGPGLANGTPDPGALEQPWGVSHAPLKEDDLKKLMILAAATMMLTGAMSAQADEGMKGGLGFHVGESPVSGVIAFINPLAPNASQAAATVGGRQWLNSQVGFDLGLGYNSFKAEQGTQSETWTGITFELGLPMVLKKFDKVNFILRPGFQYGTLEDKDETALPTLTTKYTMTGVSGTFEAEWMVADNMSISASHGLAWASIKDDGSPQIKFTSMGTTGNNFTQLGFNIYLW